MEGAKDPDEYVIKYGSGRFKLLIDQAISLVEFKVKVLKKNYNLDNTNDKIKFLQEIAKILIETDSQIELEIQLDNISKAYGISKEAIYAEINKIKYNNRKQDQKDRKIKQNIIRKKEKKIDDATIRRENVIIYLLINGNDEVRQKIKNSIDSTQIKYPLNKEIIEKIYEYLNSGKEISNNILDNMDSQDLIGHFTNIMADDYEITDYEKSVDDIIMTYNKELVIERRNEILQELENNENHTKEEIASYEKELNEIVLMLAKMK